MKPRAPLRSASARSSGVSWEVHITTGTLAVAGLPVMARVASWPLICGIM